MSFTNESCVNVPVQKLIIIFFKSPGDFIAVLSGGQFQFVGEFLDLFFVQSKFQKRAQQIDHLHKTDVGKKEIIFMSIK
jgi:hypothetical protein